jgi:hypothetical protein
MRPEDDEDEELGIPTMKVGSAMVRFGAANEWIGTLWYLSNSSGWCINAYSRKLKAKNHSGQRSGPSELGALRWLRDCHTGKLADKAIANAAWRRYVHP